MSSFKALSAEEIRNILDARDESGNLLHQDVLTPLAENEERIFKSATCPKCGSQSVVGTIDTQRPFKPDYPLPNKIGRCVVCQTEFDPYTRLIRLARLIDGPG